MVHCKCWWLTIDLVILLWSSGLWHMCLIWIHYAIVLNLIFSRGQIAYQDHVFSGKKVTVPKLWMYCFCRIMLILQCKSYQPSPPFCWGWQLSVPSFEKMRIKENEFLGRLKEFLPWIFAWEEGGLLYFLSKKSSKNKIWRWRLKDLDLF